MRINRGGFVAQVAFITTKDEDIPIHTNLCELTWKFVGGLLKALIIVISLITACLWRLLFAERPAVLEGDPDVKEHLFCRFEHWPEVWGHRVWPVIFVGPVLLWWVVTNIPFDSLMAMADLFFVLLMLFCLLVVMVMVQDPLNRFLDRTSLRLRAVKAKICPEIDIK